MEEVAIKLTTVFVVQIAINLGERKRKSAL
jgi:hypothetical protein